MTAAPPDPLLAEAHRLRDAGRWADALARYETLRARDPAAGERLGLPISIGHCRIEIAAPDALDALTLDDGPGTRTPDQVAAITAARHRALTLCGAGEFRRAARLLRFLGRYDGPLSHVYADGIDAPRSTAADTARRSATDAPPPFLAATGLTDAVVAAARARHHGRRILVAGTIYPTRDYEVLDNLVRAAARFGLVTQRFHTHLPGRDPDDYAGALLAAILDFKPDIIYYADLFEFDLASFSPAHAEQIAEVLALARRTLGVRVVRYLTDAWRTVVRLGGDLHVGLGTFVDLVVHQYPGVLDVGSAAQRAAVFCYPSPCEVPRSTVEQGTVPRACFAGRMHEWAYTRSVWWAECGRAGLPIDFQVQFPWETAQILDPPVPHQDYADRLRRYALSLSLTGRDTGARIMTMRTLETLLCGGALLEEAADDTAYFLTPGRHCAVFRTLADLEEMIPALLADRPRRLALAEAGRRWAETYFTGDYFWAGLLDKLAALPG